MKHYLLFSIVLSLFFYSCKTKSITYPSAEVVLVTHNNDGTLILKSAGYGKNFNDAVENAHAKAFEMLLFRGIPGTKYSKPLINDPNFKKSEHQEYFDQLYNEKYYKTFIVNSVISSKEVKVEKGEKIYVDIAININAFLRDLEQNSIIRKFGY